MADDLFGDLLELEDGFYQEGFEAGVADSAYAGMIEGKVFGIEKGYEKALELAKMHGRAMLWNTRLTAATMPTEDVSGASTSHSDDENALNIHPLGEMQTLLPHLPANARLQKHVENLLALTDGTTVKDDNSDEAVTELDDRLAKARAKAKVIANIVGEPLNSTSAANTSIEEAIGLNARH